MTDATDPRRICLVTETYPPEINGVALTLARLAERVAGARSCGLGGAPPPAQRWSGRR